MGFFLVCVYVFGKLSPVKLVTPRSDYWQGLVGIVAFKWDYHLNTTFYIYFSVKHYNLFNDLKHLGATNMEKYVWTDAQDMGNLHT